MAANVNTPKFRVSYPNVFKPFAFKPKGNEPQKEPEYSIIALFKKGENLKVLEDAAKAAIIAKWGPDKAKWPTGLKSPFRRQEELAKEVDGKRILPAGHEEGAIFIRFKSKQRPGVVDQNVQDIIEESQFYAGCYARASVNAYAYDQMGNKGVAFGLGNVQKMGDGEPLGNRTRPEHDFAPVTEEGAAPVSTGGDIFS